MPDNGKKYDDLGPKGEYQVEGMTKEEEDDADRAFYELQIKLGAGVVQEALYQMEKRNPSKSLAGEKLKDPLEGVYKRRILRN